MPHFALALCGNLIIFAIITVKIAELDMKPFDRIVIVIEAFCAFGLFLCFIPMFILTPGTEPDDVLSAVDLELPNYKIVNESDNLDRTASHLDNFTYDIIFPREDSTALINQMQGADWEKEDDLYIKSVDVDYDLTYSAFIEPRSGKATLDVLIEEDYSLIFLIYAIPILLFALLVAVIWGIVKIVSVNKNRKRKFPEIPKK